MSRLPPVAGEWIDRSRTLHFTFEGHRYEGLEGDTIASALAANDVRVLGRSFKYHRPRGLLSAANHDVNALMQWGERPNVRADATALVDGMSLEAVNTFGGLAGDSARHLDRLSPFLPVGFYYKAFHSKRWFPRWERMFRRIAGLGRIAVGTPRIKTPNRYDFCDVLVIGGGPSGLSAALAAADAGAKVTLVDENTRLGGSGEHERVKPIVDKARSHSKITICTDTFAAGYYADHWIPLVDANRMTKMRAKAVVVCTGVFEQPAVFRNNDLPGVMSASGAQRLVRRYAVKPFSHVVVLAANADAERAVRDFAAHGIEIAAVVDLHKGEFIHEARGSGAVSGVVLNSGKSVDCDGVAMSVGWAPAAGLLYQAGAKMRYAKEIEQFVPQSLPKGVFAAGRVNGVYDFENRLLDGERTGLQAAGSARQVPAVKSEGASPTHPYPIFPHPKGKNFVDFDEDVTLADLENAAQEGFDSIELLKRYTTVGMGPSQGKLSNMNAIRVLARIRGEPVEAIGTTTARPFFHPVPMAVLSGRSFPVERRTPLHTRHEALGAKFMDAGQWRRPEYYRVEGKPREACIHDEALAVRGAAGIIDVGTLGKIEISGPGAAELIERVYTGRFANLRVGMTRYGIMLDESGVVVDDGVIARLGPERFYFTTTTSGSAAVYRELNRLNAMWRLECGIVNATGHYGAVNIAGPLSRQLLARLTRADLSESAFPYLGVREIQVSGIPVRSMRVGFVGEMGYELHAAAGAMPALWDALQGAGGEARLRPFGVEAQRLLRLEKGHLIIGQDTDGLTTPTEAGCDWAVKMEKPFFIGQRSLRIIQKKPPRQLLVGFEVPQNAPVLESHLAISRGEIAGRVTSVAWSPTLSKHIGLAMLRPDVAGGTHFDIRGTRGAVVRAAIVPTPFYDAENRRQKLAEAG
jgi:sarcosine oxidase, subunit alpha